MQPKGPLIMSSKKMTKGKREQNRGGKLLNDSPYWPETGKDTDIKR